MQLRYYFFSGFCECCFVYLICGFVCYLVIVVVCCLLAWMFDLCVVVCCDCCYVFVFVFIVALLL